MSKFSIWCVQVSAEFYSYNSNFSLKMDPKIPNALHFIYQAEAIVPWQDFTVLGKVQAHKQSMIFYT